MKHKRLFLASLVCMFCCLITLTSCQKSNECTGVIYTYVEDDITGITTPIGGCQLDIGYFQDTDPEKELDPNIKRSVLTDPNGYYEGTWSREVYLLVEAKKQVNSEQYLYGIGYLDLLLKNTTKLLIPLELRNY